MTMALSAASWHRPRALHPGAWWLWALGLAIAASRTENPLLLLGIVAVTGYVVAARRPSTPWSQAYVAFLRLGHPRRGDPRRPDGAARR